MYSITYINSTENRSKVVRGDRFFGMERSIELKLETAIAATINRELRASFWLPPFATDSY